MNAKSLPFFLLACFIFSFAKAQITTGNVSYLFNPAPPYIYGVVLAPATSNVIGNAGTQVNWDFTQNPEDYLDTLRYYHNVNMPMPNLFANAVLGSQNSALLRHGYYFVDQDSIDELGVYKEIGWGTPAVLRNRPARKHIRSQMTYGSTLYTAYLQEAREANTGFIAANFDSIYFKDQVEEFDTIDAWGQALIPLYFNGSSYLDDCIRNKVIEVHSDSTFGRDTTNGWQFLTRNSYVQTRYEWISRDYYVAEAIMDRNDPDSLAVFRFLYAGFLLSLPSNDENAVQISCVPNPAKADGQILISFPNAVEHVELDLYDVRGLLVLRILEDQPFPSGENKIQWPTKLSTLAQGSYFLVLRTENSVPKTRKVQIL